MFNTIIFGSAGDEAEDGDGDNLGDDLNGLIMMLLRAVDVDHLDGVVAVAARNGDPLGDESFLGFGGAILPNNSTNLLAFMRGHVSIRSTII